LFCTVQVQILHILHIEVCKICIISDKNKHQYANKYTLICKIMCKIIVQVPDFTYCIIDMCKICTIYHRISTNMHIICINTQNYMESNIASSRFCILQIMQILQYAKYAKYMAIYHIAYYDHFTYNSVLF
jgi:hypothetical protein